MTATDAAGLATCQIVNVNQPQGTTTLKADFAGDAYYLSSTASRSVVVFVWTPGGNFVIGDGNDNIGATATFWADNWYQRNSVSGRHRAKLVQGLRQQPAGQDDVRRLLVDGRRQQPATTVGDADLHRDARQPTG